MNKYQNCIELNDYLLYRHHNDTYKDMISVSKSFALEEDAEHIRPTARLE